MARQSEFSSIKKNVFFVLLKASKNKNYKMLILSNSKNCLKTKLKTKNWSPWTLKILRIKNTFSQIMLNVSPEKYKICK